VRVCLNRALAFLDLCRIARPLDLVHATNLAQLLLHRLVAYAIEVALSHAVRSGAANNHGEFAFKQVAISLKRAIIRGLWLILMSRI